jgi:SAM-dependent methyltransferase
VVRGLRELATLNASRWRLHHENAAFASTVPAGAHVLDAGAGEGPYRHLFDHAHYESADFEQVDKPYGSNTYVCDLAAIPVEDHRFDYVVFNQVMEHLPRPSAVLDELRRVLKPGGRLLYTAPLFYEEHEVPYDFYRYTRYGVTHLFETAGFSIERLDWLEGYYATVGYQLRGMARALPSAPRDVAPGLLGVALAPAFVAARVAFGGLSVLFQRLELRHKYTTRGYPKNYVAIVRRCG